MMKLRYFLPRSDLREFVRTYYYYSTDVPTIQPICAELGNIRIVLDGEGVLQLPGGSIVHQKNAFLIGPTMGAYKINAVAGTRVFGIGIRPRGWSALFGFDASEAADQVIDLTACLGRLAADIIEDMNDVKSIRNMARLTDHYMSKIIYARDHKVARNAAVLESWISESRDLRLDSLLENMDVSRRQTERIAKQYFGASPKMLQRKYRALRAADRMRMGAGSVSSRASYYDQSHFIKEFKIFMGVTPSQFINRHASLISEFANMRPIVTPVSSLASV